MATEKQGATLHHLQESLMRGTPCLEDVAAHRKKLVSADPESAP
jgi:hypothetical protein